MERSEKAFQPRRQGCSDGLPTWSPSAQPAAWKAEPWARPSLPTAGPQLPPERRTPGNQREVAVDRPGPTSQAHVAQLSREDLAPMSCVTSPGPRPSVGLVTHTTLESTSASA